MEPGDIMTRQNFGFPVFSGSPSCSRCCVRARVEVDTSAGRLSEAKTQRRPECERVRGEGGFSFVVLLFLYLSFEQGKKKTRRGEDVGEEGRWVKRGGGLRRVAACLWGSLRATLRDTLATDAPRFISRRRCSRTTGPARVHRLKEVVEVYWG